MIKEAYLFNRSVIEWTAGHKKPTEDEQKLIQGRLTETIKKVADLKDSRNPLNTFFLFSVEVIQATLWIISPMPGPTAESFIETSSFYGNKILVQKQEHQVVWVRSLNELIRANVAYVKEFFLNGLIWNPNGKSIVDQLASQAPKPEESKSAPKKPEETKIVPKKKEPKKLERGISWIFEYFENDKTIVLPEEETGMKKAVMIDNCINCVIQIKGKVKSIVVSGCKGTSIVCQDVVSGVELINCVKMQIQTTGKVPSVTIDKTDGLQLYIPREGYEELMMSSSKSTDMNIVMPGLKPDDDSLEIPIPHQYVHKIVNGKVTCAPSDLYSH